VIEKLMLRLKSELTLVLVTHDLEQALRVSDYVAFMKFGSIEGWGARRRR
jgi:phosphate transport system ATP-binding protein